MPIFSPALIILLYGILKCRGGVASVPVLAGLAAGMGCVVCGLGIELAEMHLIGYFGPGPELKAVLIAFAVAAPTEEGLKFVALLALMEFAGPRPMQRILLAALAIGVGFAVLENIVYLYQAPDWAKLGLAVARAGTAVPAHGLFALVMGSLVVSSAIYPDSRGMLLALAFLMPWMLHGLYDLFAMSPATTGLPQQMRWVLAIGALFAIRHFNRILPQARAEDGARGDIWQSPPRVLLFITGLVGLLWPVIVLSTSVRVPALAHAVPMLSVLPGAMASDLLASAFRRDRIVLLH